MGNVFGSEPTEQEAPPAAERSRRDEAPAATISTQRPTRQAAAAPAPSAAPSAEDRAKAAVKAARKALKTFELELEHVESLLKRWIEGRKAKRSRGKKKGVGAKKLKETGLPIPKDGDKAQKKRQFVNAFVDNVLPRLDSLDLAGNDSVRQQRRSLVRNLEDLDKRAGEWLEEKLSQDPMKATGSSKGKGKGKGGSKAAGGGGGARKGRTHVPKAVAGSVPGFEAPEREGEATSSKKKEATAGVGEAPAPAPAPAAAARPTRLARSGPATPATLGAAACAEADAVLTQLAEELQDPSLRVGHDEGWLAASAPAAGHVARATGGGKGKGAAGVRPTSRKVGGGKGKGASGPFVFASGGPMKVQS